LIVFAYGSLVGDGAVPHTLHGYRRYWGVAMDNRVDIPGYKHFVDAHGGRPAVYVCFLDLRQDPAASVSGVAIEVEDLAALDARERNYRRIEVEPDLYAYVGSADGRARRERGLADGTARISRQYAEAVEAGFAALGLPYEADPDPCPRADLRVVHH
jgi:Gamma-glutamyl cyclotransferase, AIG2-like